MDMSKLKAGIEVLAKEELEKGTKHHGPHTSTHQAYGVLKEEVEESEAEIADFSYALSLLWEAVKADDYSAMKNELERVKMHLTGCIAESIQALAMVYKFENYLKEVNGGSEK